MARSCVMMQPGILTVVPHMTDHVYRLALTMGYIDVTRQLRALVRHKRRDLCEADNAGCAQ